MINNGDYIAIFNSVHRVMKAEKLLKAEKIPMLLIPAPREVAADCGLAIRYGEAQKEQLEAFLANHSLLPEELYKKCDNILVKQGAAE